MKTDKLKQEQLIKAPFLPEPCLIKKIVIQKSHVRLEVLTETTNRYLQKLLTKEQVEQIVLIKSHQFSLSENSEDFFYLIEANRIRLAHQFDPLLAINVSQVDPLPHQIEAVYNYILNRPKVRFLLADDPGAGKTIMAGLTLRELQQRHLVDRCLIVSPGHLQEQWQREMKEKFRLNFRIINRDVIRAQWAENVWEENNFCITSMDFAKQEDIKLYLTNVQWDLIIVDEAHKMAAYKYGDKIKRTNRYKLGETLTDETINMLFLTATPHKGDEENFRLFLNLLEPGLYSNVDMVKKMVDDKENSIFLRRLKENLRNFEGQKIFPPRNVKTVEFRLNPEEKLLYDQVTTYVQKHFDRARENRHITFALMILQRRLCSSVNSVYESLKRRRNKLEKILDYPEEIEANPEKFRRVRELSNEEYDEEYSDLTDSEREDIEKKLEMLTYADNIEQVKEEIGVLEDLIKQAEITIENRIESKLDKLNEKILEPLGNRKLLIFTEFKDTLYYLERILRSWGYSVTKIHGGMDLQSRIDAENEFKHDSQIMVATEAAGEGINLQFCSWMVNYDIPWNPNRLEQRMGRIHRYGQDHEVYIFNLITKDTMEGQVLDKLFKKLDSMREYMGSDQVFDVIGELFADRDLKGLMEDAITQQRTIDEITQKIDQDDVEERIRIFEKIMLKSLATEHLDMTSIEKKQIDAHENRLVPEYIEEFFTKFFERLGGRYTKREEYYNIRNVPYDLKRFNDDTNFVKRYGKVRNKYRRVVFDKDSINSPKDEFVAPGHPLLEAVNEYILRELNKSSRKFSVFADPDNEKEGIIWFVLGEITEGSGEPAGRRIFSLFQNKAGEFKKINASVLWDLKPIQQESISDELKELIQTPTQVDDFVLNNILIPYKEEVQEKRDHAADIKEKYGIQSLKNQIMELKEKNVEFDKRVREGDISVKGQITKNKRKIRNIEKKQEKLKQEITHQRHLTVSAPQILGATIVLPINNANIEQTTASMSSNKEIEEVGMEVAERFEKDNGRRPEIVAEENLGFDIRSWRENEEGEEEIARYIEVKARAGIGKISITPNEWLKAKRFKDSFWLYIISNAGTDKPELKKIQNPAEKFKSEEIAAVVRYIISKEKWEAIGE